MDSLALTLVSPFVLSVAERSEVEGRAHAAPIVQSFPKASTLTAAEVRE